jgi:hypothetical protein
MIVTAIIKKAFRSFNTPSEITLADNISDNKFFPFKQIHLGKLELTSRYTGFYVSVIGLIASMIAAITYIIFGVVDGHSLRSPLLPIPFFLIAISIAGMVNFSDFKTLVIYPLSNEYSYSYGSKQHIKGDKHNIYVRLRRDHRPGKIHSGQR